MDYERKRYVVLVDEIPFDETNNVVTAGHAYHDRCNQYPSCDVLLFDRKVDDHIRERRARFNKLPI